jgi:hypothetical protein
MIYLIKKYKSKKTIKKYYKNKKIQFNIIIKNYIYQHLPVNIILFPNNLNQSIPSKLLIPNKTINLLQSHLKILRLVRSFIKIKALIKIIKDNNIKLN